MSEKPNWKAEELDRAISLLAENLLRIIAGAGKVQYLEKQLKEADRLATEVSVEHSWAVADSAMEQALQLHWPFLEGEDHRDFNEDQHRMHSIVVYSLRLAAAKITGNNSDASKNQSELRNSLRCYEEEQRERRERNARRTPNTKKARAVPRASQLGRGRAR